MALFDSLTGLPNRRLFFDRLNMTLEHNRRHKGMFSVFYLDLDGLKKVNDSLGHEAGDEVLCAVSQRLKNVIRKSDTVARIGGDEYAIIVDQIKSEKEAEIAVKKIISSFAKSIQLSTGSVDVGVSIGISLYPVDSNKADELIRLADNSMYISKNKGKNTYTFYCRDINTQEMPIAAISVDA
jgi:diguanylate cyclase (GGDEF)-like protein